MKINVVLIVWWDALTDTGWKSQKEVEKVLESGEHIVRSVGVIVKRDKRSVYLCADFGSSEDSTFNRTIVIPVGWIKSIKSIYRG